MSAIVAIDDRPAKRRQLLELAATVEAGLRLEGFADLRGALAAAVDDPPQLVIIGRTMPTLNGVRAIRRFRRIEGCEDVPIVVIGDPEDRRQRYRALEAGASDFFADPPDPGEFALRARNLISAYGRTCAHRMRAELLDRSLSAKERRYRRDLRATRDSLRGIVDTIPAMVSVADREGNCVFMNQFMAAFYGHDPEAVMGIPLEEVFGPEHGAREKASNAEVFRGLGAMSGYEEDIVDSGGVARTFLSTKSALRDEKRRVVNVVTVSQDITFRKWVEAELREAKTAAEAASRVKTEFLAKVSHELRTPLNAIIGFSDGMADDLFGTPSLDRYRDYAGHISESARHLKGIIDDILDIASIEAGGLDVDIREANPAALVSEVVRALEWRAAKTGITLRVDRLAELPAIRTDPGRLSQILRNLVSNAVKFSPENGAVRIEIAADPDGGARITVCDSGAGIDAADLPRATDRFSQLTGDPMTDPVGGMGLGLPLSIGLAELLGAHIEIDSVKGAGTRVGIVFPREKLVRLGRRAG